MSQELEVRINKSSGKIEVEAFGFQGTGCLEAVDKLMAQIGGNTVADYGKDELVEIVRQVRATQ